MLNSLHYLQRLEFLENAENRRERRLTNRFVCDYDEIDFHRRYRLTKSSVSELLRLIEDEIKPNSHLNNSLNALEQLLIALRFYATGAQQLVLGDLVQVSQPTVSRIIFRVSRAIASLREQFIAMPETEEECLKISKKFFHIAHLPSVIGSIDCTHVPIISPGGIDAERFRNRKGIFSVNVQTVVSADLLIQNVVARWPGSTHDSTILNNSTLPDMMQSHPILRKYHLLGDSGYACQPFLLTPLSEPTLPPEINYNTAHILTRNTVERSYGVLKQRFPCLRYKLRCCIDDVPTVIVACCVLHNLALKLADPEPPIDPEVQAYINRFEDRATNMRHTTINNAVSSALQDSSAGFARRRLLIQRFF